MRIYSGNKKTKELPEVFKQKILDYHDNQEAMGNINYHLALVYAELNKYEKAKAHFKTAKENFLASINKDSLVLHYIEEHMKSLIKVKTVKKDKTTKKSTDA